MTELSIYHFLLVLLLLSAPVTFISLFFFTAPYGRYSPTGWGLQISSRLGWIVMEMPAVLVILYFFLKANVMAPAYVF